MDASAVASGRVTESTVLMSSAKGRRSDEASSASAVPFAMRLLRSRSEAICWRRGFFILDALERFEKPASRRATVSASGAGRTAWLAAPSPYIIVEECASDAPGEERPVRVRGEEV